MTFRWGGGTLYGEVKLILRPFDCQFYVLRSWDSVFLYAALDGALQQTDVLLISLYLPKQESTSPTCHEVISITPQA